VTDPLSLLLAIGFYAGMFPLVPGLWGAALGLLLWFCCRNLPLAAYSGIAAGLFVVGAWAAGRAEQILGQSDAKPIVIDETLGTFVALAGAARMRFGWLWGFLIFLLLDVVKPFPASWLDANLPGGLGVMLDDVVVGFYALLTLLVVSRFAGKPLQSTDNQREP
jgi:phosphatidylglycerophosphatase A